MPYMRMYETSDGKWHLRTCKKLKMGYIDSITLGVEDKDPPLDELCEECHKEIFGWKEKQE